MQLFFFFHVLKLYFKKCALQEIVQHLESFRRTENPVQSKVRRCGEGGRAPPAPAPLLPHRGIDLQLISPVALRGPWDKVLSLLLIRNHDCPC